MKQYLRGLFVAVVVVLFWCGGVYGADKPTEIVADAVIPAAWGTLRNVIQFPNYSLAYLYFEDSQGNIRKVTLENNAIYGSVIVINRSK